MNRDSDVALRVRSIHRNSGASKEFERTHVAKQQIRVEELAKMIFHVYHIVNGRFVAPIVARELHHDTR